ncbi:MAG: MBL fold metallo-hydrolase [Christensenellaceae bacterium]|jgi:competence protein ComEC|nr:MBL fold metallo-hydrolase [Christensenellaceae bacterium]
MPKNYYDNSKNKKTENKRSYQPRSREGSDRSKRASAKAKRPENFLTILLILFIIAAVVLMTVVFREEMGIAIKNISSNGSEQQTTPQKTVTTQPTLNDPFEFTYNNTDLEVHFLDVGQGDSIFIRFLKINKNILIDAGSSTGAGSKATAEKLTTFISGLGVTTINYFIATHPDSDHINLADDILTKYQVDNIYFNDVDTAFDKDSTASKSVQDTLEDMAEAEPNATIVAFDPNGRTYDIISTSGYKFTVYAPGLNVLTENNAMSPICVLEYKDRRVIFTGDATEETEAWFISLQKEKGNTTFDCDILKIGHHGSSTSSTEEFLEFLDPEYGVISVGESNSYKHPDPFIMNRLFNYSIITYRTNRHGNISLCIDSDGNFAFIVDDPVPTENNRLLENQHLLSRESIENVA